MTDKFKSISSKVKRMRRGITGITTTLMAASKDSKVQVGGHGFPAATWKKITFLGVFPALFLIAVAVSSSIKGTEHERPEFKRYEYMRIRNKAFPWDPKKGRTFFHNPDVNALVDGYEDELDENSDE